MTNFHRTFGDFDTHLMLGSTTENTQSPVQNLWGYNFITAGTISFANIAATNQFFSDATVRKRLVGAFGEVGISYKDFAYLTATGRNDWSSTLPLNNRSYFYPSVSGSFVFTQLLPRIPSLSFGKVRASWAQVGKDANPYFHRYLCKSADQRRVISPGRQPVHQRQPLFKARNSNFLGSRRRVAIPEWSDRSV